jgi:hypothetical protein
LTAKSNKRAANGRVSQKKSPESSRTNPGQWTPTIKKVIKMRYLSNAAATSKWVTDQDLMDSKVVATGVATMYRILNAIRLKSVEVWAANVSASTARTIAVEFTTNNAVGFGENSMIFSDTALGVSDIAHVKCKPPKDSYAAQWHSNSSANPNYELFNVTCPTASIIDVEYEASFIDDEPQSTVYTAPVAVLTVGTLYTRSLDASNAGGLPAANTFIPIMVNTII